MRPGSYIRTPEIKEKQRLAHIGKPSGFKGHKQTKEAKEKMRQARIEYHKTHGHPKGMLGKKHSEETKKVLSILNYGENNKMYGKHHTLKIKKILSEMKMGNIPWNKGKKGLYCCSEETKKKISLVGKGRKHSEETKRKIGIAHKGEKNYNWKGGKYLTHQGYAYVYQPGHAGCNSTGYIFEHRHIMELKLGRFLESFEVVHHINSIRNDNRPENLQLFYSHSEHIKHHCSLRKKLNCDKIAITIDN